MRLKIFNPAGCPAIDTRRIRTIVAHVLRSEKTVLNDIHIIIVDDAYMTGLNKEFFSIDRPTNVISFDLDDVKEIYVSCTQVRDSDDLYYFIVHGLLHVLGYTHDSTEQEKTMDRKCAAYVKHAGGGVS